MYVNVINSCRDVVAICDKELIGKVFLEGEKILDLKSSFYDGEEIKKENLKKTIEDSYFITVIGENSTKYVLDLNLLDTDSIKRIKNIPYSLILREN